MAAVTIRRAEVADAEGLGRCLDAAYASFAARIPDLPSMSADCAGEIERNLVWVAEAGDTIVGGLVLSPRDGYMLLVNVAVHPETRGTGAGKALLALAESEAVRRGYGELRLKTHAEMPETVALYTRNGWEETGRDGNTISMRKGLTR